MAYDPVGAMGGLFAPAHIFGDPIAMSAAEDWNIRNRRYRPTETWQDPQRQSAKEEIAVPSNPRDAIALRLASTDAGGDGGGMGGYGAGGTNYGGFGTLDITPDVASTPSPVNTGTPAVSTPAPVNNTEPVQSGRENTVTVNTQPAAPPSQAPVVSAPTPIEMVDPDQHNTIDHILDQQEQQTAIAQALANQGVIGQSTLGTLSSTVAPYGLAMSPLEFSMAPDAPPDQEMYGGPTSQAGIATANPGSPVALGTQSIDQQGLGFGLTGSGRGGGLADLTGVNTGQQGIAYGGGLLGGYGSPGFGAAPTVGGFSSVAMDAPTPSVDLAAALGLGDIGSTSSAFGGAPDIGGGGYATGLDIGDMNGFGGGVQGIGGFGPDAIGSQSDIGYGGGALGGSQSGGFDANADAAAAAAAASGMASGLDLGGVQGVDLGDLGGGGLGDLGSDGTDSSGDVGGGDGEG